MQLGIYSLQLAQLTELNPTNKSENDVLALFLSKDEAIVRTPCDIDNNLKLGMTKVIDIFLELEFNGYLQWLSLNLLDLELGRSTEKIYEEVYNSKAQLTSQGRIFLRDSLNKVI